MRMSTHRLSAAGAVAASLALAGVVPAAAQDETGSVVVTTEVLGSLVDQMVGETADVTVIMPTGADPHSYEASARDAERMLTADVLISNGLELEESLLGILEDAEAEGVTWFQATDHVAVLEFDEDEDHDDHEDEADDDLDHEDEVNDDDHDDHDHGPEDPHIWTDPVAMIDVVGALVPVLADAGIDASAGADALITDLQALDAEVAEIISVLREEDRKLVTGHRSLGYFADRYGFEQIGTVIPSLSTNGEPSARELAELIEAIGVNDVPAVFAEVGTPQAVAEAVASDSGAELVPLNTSQLPLEGGYQALIREIATTVANALTDEAR